ncbi:2-beta-glucuronyltransferase [Novosphingobium chloroacetimidivorans]|uniref:2-beta-glucuronyltransferase n=1 Tax=Novosphingobium chloroacetimidivorans TaxID=1428314 RepID=A0A7W7KED6_9SPHN|nr:glycosyltransferase family 1 protein [Novosphingobium chloroacetimidivorans]MBB4860970.1 2-beta-glucuronyltransferase [Novosphingobium chloroacetimidivorans]
MTSLRGRVVFLSAFQDYRTKKRASVQQVADGARNLGYEVWFVSTRYSRMSRRTGDSRLSLDHTANSIEEVNGINCFLWKTLVHPFASRSKILNALMNKLFTLYAAWPNAQFDEILRSADYVVIESSVAAIFLPRIRRLAPKSRIIYYATDRLDTVGAHPAVQRRLIANEALIHHASLRSARMAKDFSWLGNRLYLAEFGVHHEDFRDIGPSPYINGRPAAVSVGSMLFDRRFFETIPSLFPNVDFHVIGCGEYFSGSDNLYVHDEMTFKDTLPFVKHAAVGIAPYRPAPGVEYLADSSLKLAQYELFGLPAVCPHFAVGEVTSRAGYAPGDMESMREAMGQALSTAGSVAPRQFKTWEDVAERILNPELFDANRL